MVTQRTLLRCVPCVPGDQGAWAVQSSCEGACQQAPLLLWVPSQVRVTAPAPRPSHKGEGHTLRRPLDPAGLHSWDQQGQTLTLRMVHSNSREMSAESTEAGGEAPVGPAAPLPAKTRVRPPPLRGTQDSQRKTAGGSRAAGLTGLLPRPAWL